VSAAAAGAPHSERRRREVLYRLVELSGMGYAGGMIERVIDACRCMTFLGIGGLLLGLVLWVLNAFIDYYVHGGRKLILVRWPDVEGEPYMWALHANEWRKRDTTGVFWDIREYRSLQSSTRGPKTFIYVENGTIQTEEEL